MNNTLEKIIQETTNFYRVHAQSFSATRQNAWPGWKTVLTHVQQAYGKTPLTVFDLACGNFRFEHFLAAERAHVESVWAVDNCADLLACPKPHQFPIEVVNTDIIRQLANDTFSFLLPPTIPTLTVCFAFMHHIPTVALRIRLLEELLDCTALGGICAISFWQFQNDERLLEKARLATPQAEEKLSVSLSDSEDAFLGWQESDVAFRFCHAFTPQEVSEFATLATQKGARVLAEFSADGKSNNLNRYLVLQKET